MTTFWVVAGAFIVTALMFVLPTLIKSRQGKITALERQTANIAIYRDQIAELDADLSNDVLSKEQYEKSKQELQKRMLLDVNASGTESGTDALPSKARGLVTAVVIMLAIPLTAISLYMTIGDTRGLLPQSQLANATQFHSENMAGVPQGHAEIKSVVDNLVARLQDNPEDIEGWVMLGRTYAIMGQYQQASATYAKLVEMIPDNAQLLSDYADVLAMTNNGSLIGRPAELIAHALSIDPEYPKALALAGTVEFEKENYEQAANYWQRLVALIPEDSQLAASVTSSIEQAKTLAVKGKEDHPVQLAQNSKISSDLQHDATSSDEVKIAANSITSTKVSGKVIISPDLASKVSATDVLFVFARAKTGSKMPLAILRLSAKDLPATFSLDDDMAMTPTMKMSSFPEVVIGARVSKSGQAVPTSGDLEGFSQPVKLGDKDVLITIDQIIP